MLFEFFARNVFSRIYYYSPTKTISIKSSEFSAEMGGSFASDFEIDVTCVMAFSLLHVSYPSLEALLTSTTLILVLA